MGKFVLRSQKTSFGSVAMTVMPKAIHMPFANAAAERKVKIRELCEYLDRFRLSTDSFRRSVRGTSRLAVDGIRANKQVSLLCTCPPSLSLSLPLPLMPHPSSLAAQKDADAARGLLAAGRRSGSTVVMAQKSLMMLMKFAA